MYILLPFRLHVASYVYWQYSSRLTGSKVIGPASARAQLWTGQQHLTLARSSFVQCRGSRVFQISTLLLSNFLFTLPTPYSFPWIQTCETRVTHFVSPHVGMRLINLSWCTMSSLTPSYIKRELSHPSFFNCHQDTKVIMSLCTEGVTDNTVICLTPSPHRKVKTIVQEA